MYLIFNNPVGTLNFCWNTLEHLCFFLSGRTGSVGTLKLFRERVGTFQQTLRC